MHKFFLLTTSTDSRVIGREYPQIYSKIETHKFEALEQKTIRTIDIKSIKLPPFYLDKKTRVTDLFSHNQSSRFMAISPKLKELLEAFYLAELSHFYPISIIKANKIDILDYDMFLTIDFNYHINFNYTHFEISSYFLGEKLIHIDDFQVKSNEELFYFYKENYLVLYNCKPTRLSFLNSIKPDCDIMVFRHPINIMLISERVKNALEHYKITGIDISEPDFEIGWGNF